MKISVLLCVFNGQKTIERAIKSILKQDFKEFEFLIINDGSNDETENIIQKFSLLDSRIKYFYKDHSGLTNSLIYGLKKASGEWIARMDADDCCKNNRLSRQLKFVEKNRNVVLLGANFSFVEDKKKTYKSNLPLENKKLISNLISSRRFFPHSSAFFSREKAMQVGGYRASFLKAQDHDLWLRLSEVGKIACCKENLVTIYDHKDRLTRKLSGYPQYIYKYTAVVSYFARQNKVHQIEKKINNNDMKYFLFSLNQYINNSKYCEEENLRKNIKKFLSYENKIDTIIKIFILIIRQRILVLLIIKNIILKTNIAYKFFMKYQNHL